MVTKSPPAPKQAAKANARSPAGKADRPPASDVAAAPRLAVHETPVTEMGELLSVDRDLIQVSPDNPRRYFDLAALHELASSIIRIGLLQPLLVGRCGGIFELIAGERRWRAYGLTGIEKIPCYVRDMTQEQITIARIAENLKREDLSEIEEARAYKAALERHGWTQSQLALELSVKQGQISNRIRLLTLPETWLNKVISREMHATQARDLVPYAEFPRVFVELDLQLKGKLPKDLTAAEWDSVVEDAITASSERLTGQLKIGDGWYSYDLNKLDKAELEKLQVRELPTSWGGTIQRAFNIELWTELANAQANADKKKQDKKLSKQVDGKKSAKSAPTAEDLKAKAEQHNKRIYRHKIAYLQRQIAGRVEHLEQEDMLVMMIGFSMTSIMGRNHMLRESAKAVGLPTLEEYPGDSKIWSWVMGLDRGKLSKFLQKFFASCCELEAKSHSGDANPSLIEAVAGILAIDLSKWRVSEDFLKPHTVDQLLGLMAEWKMLNLSNGSKAELIKGILAQDMNSKLPVPKELLAVKACALD